MLEWIMSWQGVLTISIAGLVLGGLAAVVWSLRQPDPNAKTENGNFKVQSGLIASLLATGVLAFQVPSISIDLSIIFSYASDIVTMMMPIIGVGAGISFGFALVAYIMRLFRQIF